MANMLYIPQARSAYRRNCVEATDQSVYGRESRRPIYDALQYVVDMSYMMHVWGKGIGLCVEDGKLCVVYGS